MAHIYRAFFAPMVRMNTSAGVPTTVPFLFNNILRRILKDYQPDYVGIVFDTSKPTFRDKLFEEYKAHRPKMPDELSIQLPFVRRLCEAMRLPILEWDGFEADDVLGALAKQATKANVDVVLVTNDKDMLQLVHDGVKVLRTGTGAAKSDVLVDEKKVEEILGVPPNKVTDVMALMGDSIDNIPGARDPNEKPAPGERRKPGIGEVGAREIILQFGSAEEALRRAAEVKRSSYREALQKNGKYVLLSHAGFGQPATAGAGSAVVGRAVSRIGIQLTAKRIGIGNGCFYRACQRWAGAQDRLCAIRKCWRIPRLSVTAAPGTTARDLAEPGTRRS